MNITLSIDDRVMAKARHIASARGTNLNQLVRRRVRGAGNAFGSPWL